mmetsp:Transcript_20288/g.46223  ORF Transcript_20288/g.46223 Transcript_20288/m.46223 type:complete len:281 (-) Transcript_20288:1033-1875(-)
MVTMEPFSRIFTSPVWTSPQCEKREFRTAWPRVLCSILPCMPIRLAVGMSKAMTMEFSTEPVSMDFMMAPFFWNSSMTAPWYSEGTSTTDSSYGSCFFPVSGSLRYRTCGAPTMISKPSRRMFSMRIPSCRVPRPFTLKLSEVSPASMRTARFVKHSFSSRFSSSLAVSLVDSFNLPARGDLFTPNSITTVGSSTTMGGNGNGLSRSTTVSPMTTSDMPEKAQISPAKIWSTSTFSLLLNSQSLLTVHLRISPSAPYWNPTCCPTLRLPEVTRPMQMRPT